MVTYPEDSCILRCKAVILKMNALWSSKMSGTTHRTIQCHISEDFTLQHHCSHNIYPTTSIWLHICLYSKSVTAIKHVHITYCSGGK
jgi:hypothetical protein